MTDIIVAVIVGVMSLLGVIFSNIASNSKTHNRYETSIKVMNARMESLTEEVRKHNEFAKRLPDAESEIKVLMAKISILENEIKELRK